MHDGTLHTLGDGTLHALGDKTLIPIRFVWRLRHNVSTMRVVSLQRISCVYKTGP